MGKHPNIPTSKSTASSTLDGPTSIQLEGLGKSLNSGDTRLFLMSHLEALRRNNIAQDLCFSQGEGYSFKSRGWSRVRPALRARPQPFGTVRSIFAMGSLSLTIRWHSRSVIRMTCWRSIVSQIVFFFCGVSWHALRLRLHLRGRRNTLELHLAISWQAQHFVWCGQSCFGESQWHGCATVSKPCHRQNFVSWLKSVPNYL